MTRYRIIAASMLAALGLPSAANAVVTTIASFSAPSNTDNFRFVNSGGGANRTTDATFYTTSSAGATTQGSVLTKFSFLNTPLADYISNVSARFTLNGVVAKGALAGNYFGDLVQEGVSGSFSFRTTTAITVTEPDFDTHTYPVGSLLLGGTFTNAILTGERSSGFIDDSNSDGTGTVVYSSDFLDFSDTTDEDLDFSLTGISPVLSQASNKALSSFRAVLGGEAASDPAAEANGLAAPEPATWAMMVMGFGAMGAAARV